MTVHLFGDCAPLYTLCSVPTKYNIVYPCGNHINGSNVSSARKAVEAFQDFLIKLDMKYTSSGNNHSLTLQMMSPSDLQIKSYEQSLQKLGTFLENKVFQKTKLSKIFFIKSWFPSPICFLENFLGKI